MMIIDPYIDLNGICLIDFVVDTHALVFILGSVSKYKSRIK